MWSRGSKKKEGLEVFTKNFSFKEYEKKPPSMSHASSPLSQREIEKAQQAIQVLSSLVVSDRSRSYSGPSTSHSNVDSDLAGPSETSGHGSEYSSTNNYYNNSGNHSSLGPRPSHYMGVSGGERRSGELPVHKLCIKP